MVEDDEEDIILDLPSPQVAWTGKGWPIKTKHSTRILTSPLAGRQDSSVFKMTRASSFMSRASQKTFASYVASESPASSESSLRDSWGDLLAREHSSLPEDGRPQALAALAKDTGVTLPASPSIEDPSAIPVLRDDTSFTCRKTFFLDHWGRSPLTEYSIHQALGADGARCDNNEKAMMMCERDADCTVFSATTRHGSGVGGTLFAEALEHLVHAVPDFDATKEARVVVDDILAINDVDVLLKCQTMFMTAGCYTLAENVATRRVELCHDALGPSDYSTCIATHSLGDIFLRAGLYVDAQHCFSAVLDAKSSARAGLSKQPLLSSPSMRDLELACDSAVCLSVAVREQGRIHQAAELLQGVYDAALDKFGTAHPRTLHAAHQLGATLLRLNRVNEASRLVQKVVNQYVFLFGIDHPNTLHALITLAALQAAQGNNDAATDTYKQVLATRRVLYGSSHPETLEAYRLLAVHQHGADESPFEQLVASWTAVRGVTSLHTLCAAHDLGVWYCRMGDYSSALQSFQRALPGITKVCGSTHKATVDTYSKIFNTLMKQNNLADADVCLKSVTAAVQKRCGAEHIETCKANNNVGVMHLRLFRCQEAYHVLQGESLRAWQRHMASAQTPPGSDPLERNRPTATEDDIRYYVALQNFAWACTENFKWPEAEVSCLRAWKELRSILGENHPMTVRAMNSYGIALKSCRKLPEAEKILRQVVDVRQQVCGPEDHDLLESRLYLGVVLKLARKWDAAEVEQRFVYDARLKILGNRHSDTLDSQYYLGMLMLGVRNDTEAIRLLIDCAEGYSAIFGVDCPPACQSLNALSIAYDCAGRREEALDCMQRAVDGFLKSRGTSDLPTMILIINLAIKLQEQNRVEEAVGMFQAILPGYIELEGPAHPKPVWIASELAKCYAKLGMMEASQKYLLWASSGFEQMRQEDMTRISALDFWSIPKTEATLRTLGASTRVSSSADGASSTLSRWAKSFLGM